MLHEEQPNGPLNFHEFSNLLPYGAPWILVDRVVEWSASKKITTQKCITATDPLIWGHFKDGPKVVPGVLLIEAAAQAALLLFRLSGASSTETSVLTRCKAHFKKPVLAGELLTVQVVVEETVKGNVLFRASIFSLNELVCDVQLSSASITKEISI